MVTIISNPRIIVNGSESAEPYVVVIYHVAIVEIALGLLKKFGQWQ